MSSLTFAALRVANALRLPLFKNPKGALAHSKPDGSDWSPAQWLQAVVGELGEFARARFEYEMGHITYEVYVEAATKELADVVTYLDILARRALDKVDIDGNRDPAQKLTQIIAELGEYANVRKKFDRGDITQAQFEEQRKLFLAPTARRVGWLMNGSEEVPNNPVREAHATGVDLGEATQAKFNEVSVRVDCNVALINGAVMNGSSVVPL